MTISADIPGFFRVKHPQDVVWAHGVNSWERLRHFCSSKSTMMIEGDISPGRDRKHIIMAHPPNCDGDLLFQDWIAYAVAHEKGVKLDFKSPDVISCCLEYLARNSVPVPVVVNADVIVGPGGPEPAINANKFVRECKALPVKPLLSIGWTTGAKEGSRYSDRSIRLAFELARTYGGPVTFPIRTCFLRDSWASIQVLIEAKEYTLTLWNGVEDVPGPDLLQWIEKTMSPTSFFYDLVKSDLSPLRL
jgi:hypothetical protein